MIEPTQTTNKLDKTKLAKLLFIYLINMNVISDSGLLKMYSNFVIRADITLDTTQWKYLYKIEDIELVVQKC